MRVLFTFIKETKPPMKKLLFPFLLLATQATLAAAQNQNDDQSDSGSAIWGFLFVLFIIGIAIYIIRRNRRRSIKNVTVFYESDSDNLNGNVYPADNSGFAAGVAAAVVAEAVIDSLDNNDQQQDDQTDYNNDSYNDNSNDYQSDDSSSSNDDDSDW